MPSYRIVLDAEQFNTVLHCLAANERRYKETAELPQAMDDGVRELMTASAARCHKTALHIIDKMEVV